MQSLTGHDVHIERGPSQRSHVAGNDLVRYSHTTRAYAGNTLVGTAVVVWGGVQDNYSKLLKTRMKDCLRENHVLPINDSYD